MSVTDWNRLIRRGATFDAFTAKESTGFLFRLGFATNYSGLLYQKDINGVPILVIQMDKIFLNTASGRRSQSELSQRDWAVVRDAYEKKWRIFFIVSVCSKNPKSFIAKKCKRKAMVEGADFVHSHHGVVFEVVKDVRWHLHDCNIRCTRNYKRRVQADINKFRSYTHKFIKKNLGLAQSEIKMTYGHVPYLHIESSCVLYIMWIIQEAVKGRVTTTSLQESPILALLFLEKCEHELKDADEESPEWQWKPLSWKYDSVIDRVVENPALKWRDVNKLKAEVDAISKSVGKPDGNDDDDDDFYPVRVWKPRRALATERGFETTMKDF